MTHTTSPLGFARIEYGVVSKGKHALAALPFSQKVGSAVASATHQNQFSGTIGGPIWIPRFFNGRDKLIFFYAYEGVVGQQSPATTIGSVPTLAERGGDFSALLGLGSAYQLYNPYSATGTTSTVTRSKVPGNCLVAICGSTVGAGLTLSPIALAYLNNVPLPNYNGPTTADGENNYFAYTPSTASYRSHMGRLDYNISAKNKVWGSAHRSRYITSASNYFHDSLTGTLADQIFSGGVLEDVQTFTPTLFLDVRGSVTRYDNSNTVSSTGISPTSVGFPGHLAANSTSIALPQITFTDTTNPLSYSNQPGADENFDTVGLFTTITKIHGAHSFMLGADIRAYKGSYLTPGAANGAFTFAKANGSPVAATNTASPATFGSSLALFMLGIPTSAHITSPPHSAAHPSSLLPAASFQPTGGAIYASPGDRAAYNNPTLYVSPRLGISWSPEALKGKGVIRFGYGI